MQTVASSSCSSVGPKLLKASEVARRLDVKPYRVYSLVRGGLIPHIRVGRTVRFDPDKLQGWIDSGGQPLPPERT
jgi:excisionase family DNA binding protein